jgi:hypothetical protein
MARSALRFACSAGIIGLAPAPAFTTILFGPLLGLPLLLPGICISRIFRKQEKIAFSLHCQYNLHLTTLQPLFH